MLAHITDGRVCYGFTSMVVEPDELAAVCLGSCSMEKSSYLGRAISARGEDDLETGVSIEAAGMRKRLVRKNIWIYDELTGGRIRYIGRLSVERKALLGT